MTRVMDMDKHTQLDLEGLPRHILLTSANPTYQMRVSDSVLSVVSSAGDGSGIVTLPSVAEAVGRFYHIIAPTGLTGDDVSLFEKETGALLVTAPVGPFNSDGDHVLIMSTGTLWRMVVDGVA